MTFTKLERFIFKKAAQTRLPSVTIALINDQDVIWSHAVGYKDLEYGVAATPATLYGIGSVTKSFTALAVLQLVEQGKLSLNDPIDKYVPFTVKPFGKPILIWHLLSHTSGIPALGHGEAVIGAAVGDSGKWIPAASNTDLFSFLQDAGDWVLAKPGERWFYLNEGFKLIGAVIEKVSGIPYIDYVHQNILHPLGMTRSMFRKKDVDEDEDVAIPYINERGGRRIPSTYPYTEVAAGGGMISSVQDMAKVISMYLNWGRYKGGQLVSKTSLENMQTPQIHTAHKDGPFGKSHYALGLRLLSNFLGYRLAGHGGSLRTATAYMGFIPNQKVGVMVLANSSGYPLASIGQYGLAMMLGTDPDELPFVRIARLMNKLTGNYERYMGTGKIQVHKAGDFLKLVASRKFNTVTTSLVPVSLEENRCAFYTLIGGSKVHAEFILEKDRTTLVYERNAYRKIGELN